MEMEKKNFFFVCCRSETQPAVSARRDWTDPRYRYIARGQGAGCGSLRPCLETHFDDRWLLLATRDPNIFAKKNRVKKGQL
jgi:hypothetical protein